MEVRRFGGVLVGRGGAQIRWRCADGVFVRLLLQLLVNIACAQMTHLSSGSSDGARVLFSFFAGLVPEGWYLRIVSQTLKVDPTDTFGLLLRTCGDCIGAVSVREASND